MSNAKKTDRKNKTNQVVTWPSADSHFTIDTLLNTNNEFKEITLRVRVKNALECGTIVEIGTLNTGKGRPKLAFAMAPVTAKALETAKASEVLLKDCYSTVNVVNIKTSDSVENAEEVVAKHSQKTINA
jgi:hypothetical protein